MKPKHSETLENRFIGSVRTRLAMAALLAAMALIAGLVWADPARAEDPKPNTDASVSKPTEPKPKPETPNKADRLVLKKLTGAELYSMHCNRCHPERYPTERTAAQWKTILLHMRVRANLPAEQSRTILKYLQENSGR